MIIYFVFFIISFLLINRSNKLLQKGKKKYIIYEILGLVVLSLLAGIRDTSIGTDVEYYAKPIFLNSLKYGIKEHYAIATQEIGYVAFNYIIKTFSHDFNVYLFFLQLFILFFSYKGIKYINPKHPTLVYIIYIFLFYNRSYNVIRQSMSIALTLVSLKYVEKKDIKKFITVVLLAQLFHRSAIIFLIAYPLYCLINSNKKNSNYITVFFIMFSIFFMVFFKDILLLLINIGLLPQRFFKYTTLYYNDNLNFEVVDLLLNILIIINYAVFHKTIEKKYNNSRYYFFFILIDLICNIIGGRYMLANRIALYFRIPAEIYFLTVFDSFIKEKTKNKIVANTIQISIVVVYWLYLYGYRQIGRTVPFKIKEGLF